MPHILKAAVPTITYHMVPDAEGDSNRGWQIDHFEARIQVCGVNYKVSTHGNPSKVALDGTVCVGYLKGSHIPQARMESYYPPTLRLFAYAKHIGGWSAIELGSRKGLLQAGQYCLSWNERSKLNDLSIDESKVLWKHIQKEVAARFTKQWLAFFSHNARPFVDYSRVHNDFQRNGIATNLYRLAGRYYAQQGFPGIRASDCQSTKATEVWKYFAKQGWTSQVITRDIRDGKLTNNSRLCIGHTNGVLPALAVTNTSKVVTPFLEWRHTECYCTVLAARSLPQTQELGAELLRK